MVNHCSIANLEDNKLAVIAILISDVVLLVIMFIGLLRLRHRGGGRFGLGRLLWKQVSSPPFSCDALLSPI